MLENDAKKNEFVSLFPANKRSGVCNKILEPIRSGQVDPLIVAKIVFDKYNRFPDDNADIISIIKANTFLFIDAIIYYIEYEKLPRDEREKLKQSKSKEYVEQYMREQPITNKQIKMLEGLGYGGPFNISRLGASNIIEELIH